MTHTVTHGDALRKCVISIFAGIPMAYDRDDADDAYFRDRGKVSGEGPTRVLWGYRRNMRHLRHPSSRDGAATHG